MKKIAFILEGEKDSGKTSTIKDVVKTIKSEYSKAEVQEIKDEILSDKINIEDYTISESEKTDISLIIHLNIDGNVIKIVVESMGDYCGENERPLKTLNDFNKNECHIILCAIRNHKGRIGCLYHPIKKKLTENKYNIIWITKTRTENKDNEESAELIYGLIEKAISLILEKMNIRVYT